MHELLHLPPSLNRAVDVTALALDPQDGFILSQIDGHTPASVLCDIVGADPSDFVARLTRLEQLGAIRWRPGSREVARPVSSVATVDLDVDEQAHLRELAATLERRDHWALLGLDGRATTADIKRAYFAASKRYHPDRYFGKNLGEYRGLLEKIFGAVKRAYDTLSDASARAEYAVRQPPPIELDLESPAPVEDRAARLEARRQEILEERRQRRVGVTAAAVVGGNVRKAREMHDAGVVQLGLGQAQAAVRSFRLAVTYDPVNADYKAKLAMAEEGARTEQAVQLAARGEAAMADGQTARAAQLLSEASDAAPQKTGYAIGAAQAHLAAGKPLRAWAYAERALAVASGRADVRRIAGEVMEARGMLPEAREQLTEAVRLDPNDARARSALLRLTKQVRR